MTGGPFRFRTGGGLCIGLGIALTCLAVGCFPSSSSSDSSASKAGLECHELARYLRREIAGTHLDVEAVFNVFFDEDGTGVSSVSVGAATTFSFSGLVSKAGGLPASL